MKSQPPADLPDWSRETPRAIWDPSRRLLQTIRKYQSWRERGGPFSRLLMNTWTFQHRFWSVVTGAEIPLDSEIEGGLLIPHPNGIVIHPQSKIGPNCLIFQQVTLGTRGDSGAPIIGGRVDIGAGARVLGDVVIRDYSKIGANALVLSSFPEGSVLVGIPARRVGLSKKARPRKLRSRVRFAAGQN